MWYGILAEIQDDRNKNDSRLVEWVSVWNPKETEIICLKGKENVGKFIFNMLLDNVGQMVDGNFLFPIRKEKWEMI